MSRVGARFLRGPVPRAVLALFQPGRVVRRGHGTESEVRRTTVDGIVDTGAVTLMLPQNVVERLGLERQDTAFVTCANERRDERALAGPSRAGSEAAGWSPTTSSARR